jgi:hypothetical protein
MKFKIRLHIRFLNYGISLTLTPVGKTSSLGEEVGGRLED